MQVEVKLSIDSAEGCERTAQTLASHHLKDECYYDFFFDFSYRALQERDSVLRLRVPCELQSFTAAGASEPSLDINEDGANSGNAESSADNRTGATTATTAAGPGGGNAVGAYDPDAAYEAFLRSCRGLNGTGGGAADAHSSTGDTLTNLSSPRYSSVGDATRSRALPQPILVAGATGKLFLKQKNTVQHGHQLTFVAEDADVPADVVEALVKLVPASLFITGMIPSSGPRPADSSTNAFTVLSAYAQRRPCADDGKGDSAIQRIVTQLTEIAHAYTPARASGYVGKRARSASQESDAHFTQVRFSGMGARSVYTQQQRAASALAEDEEEEQQQQRPSQQQRKSGTNAAAAVPQLEAVGGFSTRRQIYAYAGVHQGIGTSAGESSREAELRETRRVRLDTSFFLPGFTIYELEVPKCGVAVDDVAAEVCVFLTKLGVRYHTGSESKYARYVHCLAATRDVEQDAMDVKLRLTNVNGFEEVRRNLQRLTQPTDASGVSTGGNAPRSSQEKRYISNTEVDDADDGDGDTWWQTNPSGYLQETNEDFFFDGPEQTLRRGHTFLRLRKQRHSKKYFLVLKAHQVFVGGQQNSLSSTLELSEVIAHALVDDPSKFLREHCDNFSIMKTIWDEFGVRELCRTATFTTERVIVPWWSAKAQPSTLQRSWASASATGPTLAPPSQLIYTSNSYLLSQKQQQQQQARQEPEVSDGQSKPPPPLAPPLLIHLDKTLYKVPADVKGVRIPFCQVRPWADRQCETYEIEVTNIEGPTDPKEVIRELTELLNDMGVEWSVGVRSKLEQYFSLIDA
ncbi:hypothetical protein ABB37_02513 [Leptomonas pyrrhocoris]|uniref:CYTH domain-containing protein n=1 Tax=Leptomonas pyrrhocoris TaxID=157538 RepID=A0A0M9G5A4_LEPPY|nr:hypothetical protein ABB37_02513 [Leptomonas pyrrhocoris]KPA82690.1 hypothetical protein ABB37_02513 [Leptomonas pyrrhocoris]|eukprot:XP_015661129.1 hypothetical protein ABB37_02513 [Leptomonas pyrrhocoris]